jgi:hypothetical protein
MLFLMGNKKIVKTGKTILNVQIGRESMEIPEV